MKRMFGKRLSALLLALVMVVGMVPAASAADADLTYTVDYDESVELKRGDFYDLFEEEEDEALYYVEFTDVDVDFDDYGYFEAYDEDDEIVELDANDIEGSYFYYFDSDVGSGDYCLNGLEFVAYDVADSITLTLEFTMWDEYEDWDYDGVLEIKVVGEDDEDDDDDEFTITYEVEEDDYVEFDRKDFEKLFEDEYKNKQFSHLVFDKITNFDECGYFEALDYNENTKKLDEDDLEDAYFYYNPADLWARGEYELGSVIFAADDDTDGELVTMEFTLYDEDEDYDLDGVLYIEIGDVKNSSSSSSSSSSSKTEKGDLHYEVEPDDKITIPRKDFKDFFEDEYDDFSYLVFDKVTNMDGNGEMEVTDMDDDDVDLDEADLEDGYFYYYADDMVDEDTDYELNGMTFWADEDANGELVTFEFTLYGEDKDDKVEGTMTIQIGETYSITEADFSSLRYSITGGTAWQINVNDIARFFEKQYPGSTFQYVKLMSVPSQGGLYYDYYNTSSRTQLTASNISGLNLYRDAYGNQAALNKLTYIPAGNNYTANILFTAYGTGGRSAMGALLIGVTKNTISEVYGITLKNTAQYLSPSNIYNAVYAATGMPLASIQLLQLPASSKGTITAGTGYYSFAANTSTYYTYASGTNPMSQLKFVPATNYTGSVDIPYLAYDASGNPIAYGKIGIGVVSSVKSFSDITASTWCKKYVLELADANVIGGYNDNTFKPNNTITYGAALKLVTLAAGHGEKAPTGSHTFSGYLTYAQQKGWVTGNVNLSGNITRLQIAQLAAKAMGLSVSGLSSTRPFTDTADVYVQALNAAGIIEGYFSNGSYAYRPNNTLTRGQVSAIVWRMRNYD